MNISVEELDRSFNRFSALKEKDSRKSLADFSSESYISDVSRDIIKGDILDPDEKLIKRKEMLSEVRQEPVDFAFERAIGKNDSVYSNFVELLELVKRKVGRIAVKEGNVNIGYATGFMISERLLLTNWHVFKSKAEVVDSEVQFFYELDTAGNPGKSVSFRLEENEFYYSNQELDYCVVAVNSSDTTGKISLNDIGYIYLDPTLGKIAGEREALNIIHHPNGDYKQLSIRENLFMNITPTTIWYESDTAPGSSGSPVFNDQWQVVALHHMGVARKNINGEYVDRDNKVIPKIDGKIDASKVVWTANEGVRISVIIKDVFARFPGEKLIEGIKIQPGTNQGNVVKDPETLKNNNEMETDKPSNSVNISFPASLLEKSGIVNISINNQPGQTADEKTIRPAGGQFPAQELDQEEIKKLESSLDFNSCKGYQANFIGKAHLITLPAPLPEIRKFIAKVNGTDSMVLNYYHYSVIFHSVRMMPLISAINIDGDPLKRKDESKREDTWLRDTRLSFDIQLNDAYYSKSGFDKGHMSRREDANWGRTPEEAKRNADLTCMYTNACPQVPGLNQSRRGGLWGQLEMVILENGAMKESGRTGKITAFNGPIFKDSDPVYKGIQVPMEFYKIILWLTNNNQLKATAFRLSQADLAGDIDFEQIDIDQDIEFKQYQCSIKKLQDETKINFGHLIHFDTFQGKDDEAVEIYSENELHSLINHLNKS
jgi:endonuclease G, mitochondrial